MVMVLHEPLSLCRYHVLQLNDSFAQSAPHSQQGASSVLTRFDETTEGANRQGPVRGEVFWSSTKLCAGPVFFHSRYSSYLWSS